MNAHAGEGAVGGPRLRPSQWDRLVLAWNIAWCAAFVCALALWLAWPSRMGFDRARWLAEASGGTRLRMLPDLLRKHRLVGKDVVEITALLGAPDEVETMPPGGRSRWLYRLGEHGPWWLGGWGYPHLSVQIEDGMVVKVSQAEGTGDLDDSHPRQE